MSELILVLRCVKGRCLCNDGYVAFKGKCYKTATTTAEPETTSLACTSLEGWGWGWGWGGGGCWGWGWVGLGGVGWGDDSSLPSESTSADCERQHAPRTGTWPDVVTSKPAYVPPPPPPPRHPARRNRGIRIFRLQHHSKFGIRPRVADVNGMQVEGLQPVRKPEMAGVPVCLFARFH